MASDAVPPLGRGVHHVLRGLTAFMAIVRETARRGWK
jgi:hypothetical protein